MENNRINTKTQSDDDFIQITASTEYENLYGDDVLPEKFTKSEGKFRVLFSDVFSHHIFIDPEPPSDSKIDFLREDSKRFVELLNKRDEIRKRELLDAIGKSERTYEKILKFIKE